MRDSQLRVTVVITDLVRGNGTQSQRSVLPGNTHPALSVLFLGRCARVALDSAIRFPTRLPQPTSRLKCICFFAIAGQPTFIWEHRACQIAPAIKA